MNESLKKPIIVFFLSLAAFSVILFLFPINLFDGVIEYEEPARSYSVNAPLSLSYFIGIGFDEQDMIHVQSFRLTSRGLILALILSVGVPALIAYRVYLQGISKKELRDVSDGQIID